MTVRYVFNDIELITKKLQALRDQFAIVPEHPQLTLNQIKEVFAVAFGWPSFHEMELGQIDTSSDDECFFVDAPNKLVTYERLKMEMRMTLAKAIVLNHPTEISFTDIMALMNVVWDETTQIPVPKNSLLDESYILDSIYIETPALNQYKSFISNHIFPKLASNGGFLFCYDHEFEEHYKQLGELGNKPLVFNTTERSLPLSDVHDVHFSSCIDIEYITQLLFSLIYSHGLDDENVTQALAIIKAYGKSKFVTSSEVPTKTMLSPITTEKLIASFNSLDADDKKNVGHCLISAGIDVIHGKAISSSMLTIESTPFGEMLSCAFDVAARIFEPQSKSSMGMSVKDLLNQERPLMIVVGSEDNEEKNVACAIASVIKLELLSKLINTNQANVGDLNELAIKPICLPHDADFLPTGFYNIANLLPNLKLGVIAGGDNQQNLDKDVFNSSTPSDVTMLLASVDTLGCFMPKYQGISGLFKKREFQPVLYSKRHAKNLLSVANLDLSEETELKVKNIKPLLLA